MKQRISHGADIETATPAEVAAIISAAFERQRSVDYRRLKGIINLGATGAGVTSAQANGDLVVPSQYDLLLERVTFGGNGAPNALIGVYENRVADTDLLEIVQMGTAGKYSDSYSNCIYVTANSVITINVTGGVANLQVTYNMQGRLVKAS